MGETVESSGEPTSAWLTLPGAAGQQIAVYDLDKSRPYVMIDGVRARRDMNGYSIIPMAAGGTKKLKIKATVPGYATLTFDGVKVYESPRPPAALVATYFAFGGGAVFFGFAAFGILGGVLGIVAAFGVAGALRNARHTKVLYPVLIGLGIVFIVLGVFAMQLRLSTI